MLPDPPPFSSRASHHRTAGRVNSIWELCNRALEIVGLRYHCYLTALILSGGGMFAAWQAGAWQELAKRMPKPDWVIGASAGSLNAWAIAGGLPPEELVDRWQNLAAYNNLRWRFPAGPTSSILDPSHIWDDIDDIYSRCMPRTNIGVTLTRLPSLKVEMVINEKITPQVLRASCAVPGLFPPVKWNGHWYWDGGLMDGLPHSFGRKVGATRLVCLNVWVGLPWWWTIKGNMLHRIRRWREGVPADSADSVEWIYLAPPKMPGSFRDAAVWSRSNVERWIDEGREAARKIELT